MLINQFQNTDYEMVIDEWRPSSLLLGKMVKESALFSVQQGMYNGKKTINVVHKGPAAGRLIGRLL